MTKFTAEERARTAQDMYNMEKDGGIYVVPCPHCGGEQKSIPHNYKSIADFYTSKGTTVSRALVENMAEEYAAYRDLILGEEEGTRNTNSFLAIK
jgi:hypothetical protein